MLGNAMLRTMVEAGEHEVIGTIRSASVSRYFGRVLAKRVLTDLNVEHFDELTRVFQEIRPDVVINCIGLVKQLAVANDPLQVLPINSLLPHRLARLCNLVGARLVHVSSDCVFNGAKGNYNEFDSADAEDLYGKSKLVGEVLYPHTITLRTSIIGHEMSGKHGLVEWFLAQENSLKGYRRAIFSGLPTAELSRIVRDLVLTRPTLSGLYHVAAAPINKYELLKLVAKAYGKKIKIESDDTVVIDRSLNADRFNEITGYVAPAWPDLIAQMRDFG